MDNLYEFWENNNQVVDTTQLKSPSGKFGKKDEMITKDKEEPVSGCYWNTGYLTEETPKQFAKDMESKTEPKIFKKEEYDKREK